jgi:hypothetical protein
MAGLALVRLPKQSTPTRITSRRQAPTSMFIPPQDYPFQFYLPMGPVRAMFEKAAD